MPRKVQPTTSDRCPVRKCRAPLTSSIDPLGRVVWSCPRCALRKAGRCVDCRMPVTGKRWRCEVCRKKALRVATDHWNEEHRPRKHTRCAICRTPINTSPRSRAKYCRRCKRRARIISSDAYQQRHREELKRRYREKMKDPAYREKRRQWRKNSAERQARWAAELAELRTGTDG